MDPSGPSHPSDQPTVPRVARDCSPIRAGETWRDYFRRANIDPADQPISPPIPRECSPRRPNETGPDFCWRRRNHERARFQQYLQEHYRVRQARLMSPHSDGDENSEDVAAEIEYMERELYWASRPEDEFWAYEYPPFKPEYDGPLGSLTDDEANDPFDTADMRPEEREWHDALISMGVHPAQDREALQAEETSRHKRKQGPEEDRSDQPRAKRMKRVETHSGAPGTAAKSGPKRKRGPEEDCALQSPVKRTRAGTHTRTTEKTGTTATSEPKRKRGPGDDRDAEPPIKRTRAGTRAWSRGATATPGSKRKLGQEEDADLATEYQVGTKRRRTDARPLLPPAATKGSKRRAGKNTKRPPLLQQLQPLASSGPSPASVIAEVAAKADESKRGSSSAAKGTRQSPTRSPTRRPTYAPLRVSRAQRRLLSGKDAQLFQLGQRGELDVQRPSGQEDTSADTAHKRRPTRTETGKARQRR
ncbi:hypothetical protein VM1G_07413 [Cytospora mali]|uniref:Uncharacterized protein n=1 Tax=Cytospora mali TaxID=578113 RepID=A0A194W4T6_CYTMA|nr:hypothetical protein VM1G_07413 [Valsa mali]